MGVTGWPAATARSEDLCPARPRDEAVARVRLDTTSQGRLLVGGQLRLDPGSETSWSAAGPVRGGRLPTPSDTEATDFELCRGWRGRADRGSHFRRWSERPYRFLR